LNIGATKRGVVDGAEEAEVVAVMADVVDNADLAVGETEAAGSFGCSSAPSEDEDAL